MNENIDNYQDDIYQNDDAMVLENQEQDLEQTLDLNAELKKYEELHAGDKDE